MVLGGSLYAIRLHRLIQLTWPGIGGVSLQVRPESPSRQHVHGVQLNRLHVVVIHFI